MKEQSEPVAERHMEQYNTEQPAEQFAEPEAPPVISQSSTQRRRQGYKPDDASGVRQIYRGPEFEQPSGEYIAAEQVQPIQPVRREVPTESTYAAKGSMPPILSAQHRRQHQQRGRSRPGNALTQTLVDGLTSGAGLLKRKIATCFEPISA